MFKFKTVNFFETEKHVFRSDCEASVFEDTQSSTGHSLEQHALAALLCAGGLDKTICRSTFQLE